MSNETIDLAFQTFKEAAEAQWLTVVRGWMSDTEIIMIYSETSRMIGYPLYETYDVGRAWAWLDGWKCGKGIK